MNAVLFHLGMEIRYVEAGRFGGMRIIPLRSL